jgi:hypothetical protein
MPTRTRPERPTLAATLEHDRLRRRALRLEGVVVALRARARAYETGAVPRPLGLALEGFEDELTAVRARLEASS